jgi:predicted nucleic acid-binding Zn ribbon protein
MRCPECSTLNDENAAACSSCGLLLLKVKAELEAAKPKRRADDLAVQKRRAVDKQSELCPYCQGEVPAKSIRCKHCGEILNEEFHRQRAQRLRARINYASWVAYLFGLAALLIFRPVGMISIAAGLILSIAYYAIPAEPAALRKTKEKGTLGAFLKRQFRFERVHLPLPAFKSKKLVFVGTPLVAAVIGYSANYLLLQEPMNEVLTQNSAYSGMDISAHYAYYVVPGVVVYDLKNVSVAQTPLDVHTALLEYARKLRLRRFDRIELSYQGVAKFSIDGKTFQHIGDEYQKHNFEYVLYQVPRLFHSSAKPGEVQQAVSDHDALVRFHKQWYGRDSMTGHAANAL